MSVRDVIDPRGLYRTDVDAEEIARLIDSVVDTVTARRLLQIEGQHRVAKQLPNDYDLGLRYFNAVQAETNAVDALLAARSEYPVRDEK